MSTYSPKKSLLRFYNIVFLSTASYECEVSLLVALSERVGAVVLLDLVLAPSGHTSLIPAVNKKYSFQEMNNYRPK